MKSSRPYSVAALAELLEGELINAPSDISTENITSLYDDSRKVTPGSVFVAYEGVVVDGHDYLDQVQANGASLAIVAKTEKLPASLPALKVAKPRAALSKLAATMLNNPSDNLLSIGITGTNGKTTIMWLLYNILWRLDTPVLSIGTLGIQAKDLLQEKGRVTTPSAIELQEHLKLAVDYNLIAVVLEVSSHALDQERVADINFDIGIFTNLSGDHFDYHKNFESYFLAKQRLFELLQQHRDRKSLELKEVAFPAIINLDCNYGKRLIDFCAKHDLAVLSYGKSPEADVQYRVAEASATKSIVELSFANASYTVETQLIGEHNASNIAAVFATLYSARFKTSVIVDALQKLPCPPGRLESCGNEKVAVYVDYAHTADALKHALSTLKAITPKNLWVIFGCGGCRDRGKRPAMGRIAQMLAHRIVLTSDNSRTEPVEEIVSEIIEGGCKPYMVEYDRAKAIEETLKAAEEGDVVLIAGKGHEDYQDFGNKRIHFSDQEEVLKAKAAGLI